MRYYNLYSRTGKIDGDGMYTIESSWQLVSDQENPSQQELQLEFEHWMGKVGDFWREPSSTVGDNGECFVYNSSLTVASLELKIVDSRCGIVCYTAGVPQSASPFPSGDIKETWDRDGVRIRRGNWSTTGMTLEAYLPKIGDLLNWNGGSFACVGCETQTSDQQTFTFSITGREISTLALGGSVWNRSSDGEETQSLTFFVATENLSDFLRANPAGATAAWAGEDYVLQTVARKPYGWIGFEVTLTARRILTRLVGEFRKEEFAGLSLSNGVLKKISYHSRWFVKAADIGNYFHLAGNSPVGWGDANAIITSISPKRLSDQEFELEMTAQDRGNPGLYQTIDDHSNLSGRIDVSVDMGSFNVKDDMAGYWRNAEGIYEEIEDWNPAYSCPFEATEPLPLNLVGADVCTLEITETDYHSGRAANWIGNMADWAASRVFSGSVAGKAGPFLKIRQTCGEVRDNLGYLYTRIRRTYMLPPGGYRWNGFYWSHH